MNRVGAGIFDGVWGLLSFQYGMALEAIWDYGRYMFGWITWDELQAKQNQNMISFEDLLVLRDAIIADPVGFAKKMWDAMINAEGWEDDPGAHSVNLFRLQFLLRSPLAVEMRLVLLQCLNPCLSSAKA